MFEHFVQFHAALKVQPAPARRRRACFGVLQQRPPDAARITSDASMNTGSAVG